MWFEKFLDTISRHFPFDPLAGIGDKISALNPDRIYIENVRSILGISHTSAARICETAVRQGAFDRRIELLGPDNAVVLSVGKPQDIPPFVKVWIEETDGIEEVELPTDQLKQRTFYRLHVEAVPSTVHA